MFANTPFATIDTAITRSIRLVLFCKKGAVTNFAKSTRKQIPAQTFSCEFCKISHKIFLKNPSEGYYCINTPVYCRTTTFRLFKNDVKYIFWLSIFSAKFVGCEQEWAQYFKPLARSLFSTQLNICDGVFFAKIVNSLSIFAKKLHYRFSTRF